MKFKSSIKTSKGHEIQFDEEKLDNIIYFDEAQKLFMSSELELKKTIPLLSMVFIKRIQERVTETRTNPIENKEGIKYHFESISNYSLEDYEAIIQNVVHFYTDWIGDDEEENPIKKKS